MKEKYISFWRHSLEHSKKLEFYKVFKDEYSASDYLFQLRNFSRWKKEFSEVLKNKQIDNVPRENRLCPLCKCKQTEDKNHFLFQCQEYSSLRRVFLHQISEIVPDIERKPTIKIIKFLINSNDYFINKLVKWSSFPRVWTYVIHCCLIATGSDVK